MTTPEEIIARYSTLVMNIARSRVSISDADDVYQEVFYRYIDKEPHFKDEKHEKDKDQLQEPSGARPMEPVIKDRCHDDRQEDHRPSARTASTAASIASASAGSWKEYRIIMATERIVAMGLALPCPAMSGADPWMGSNMLTPLGLMFPLPPIPSPP